MGERALQRFTELVEPIADDFRVELVDIEQHGDVVKVVIDQEGGLESEVLVDVTKAVSRMIDDADPIPGSFTLEVTSPGLERPLKKPSHFQRAVGSDVAVKTNPDVDGDRRIEGELVAADEFGITIRSAGAGTRTLRYGEIRSARTVFDWTPAPKPGSPRTESQQHRTKESARP